MRFSSAPLEAEIMALSSILPSLHPHQPHKTKIMFPSPDLSAWEALKNHKLPDLIKLS